MKAAEARALLNDDKIWNSYFKFAFDRNPWDRQVSFYHHRYRREDTPSSFPEFIHNDKRARVNNYEIYSLDGEVAVDFVGRFENLKADFAKALSQIGLEYLSELPRAKTTFRKDSRPYRDYYDDETRRIVGDWYKREIALLDYKF
jgi:hypothetical protein